MLVPLVVEIHFLAALRFRVVIEQVHRSCVLLGCCVDPWNRNNVWTILLYLGLVLPSFEKPDGNDENNNQQEDDDGDCVGEE